MSWNHVQCTHFLEKLNTNNYLELRTPMGLYHRPRTFLRKRRWVWRNSRLVFGKRSQALREQGIWRTTYNDTIGPVWRNREKNYGEWETLMKRAIKHNWVEWRAVVSVSSAGVLTVCHRRHHAAAAPSPLSPLLCAILTPTIRRSFYSCCTFFLQSSLWQRLFRTKSQSYSGYFKVVASWGRKNPWEIITK